MIKITKELLKKFRTDSDVEEYAEENGIPARELFMKIAQFQLKDTPCYGCKHVVFRPNMYPCNSCTRIAKDRFEAK